MREKIHPNYVESVVTCSCGNSWKTRSTKPTVHLDICGACHPYFTGEQRIVDTAGRVERFRLRAAKATAVKK
jgi:large subunit ribosomal protein L31